MVRTYAFNPSVQHSGDLPGAGPVAFHAMFLPRSPPARQHRLNMTKSQPNLVPSGDQHQRRSGRNPEQFSQIYADARQGDRQWVDGFRPHHAPRDEQLNFKTSQPSLPTLNLPSEKSFSQLDDNTTLFGLQSIVINGQRYFRPLDDDLNRALNEQFAAMRSSQRSHQSSANATEAFSAALNALALAIHKPQQLPCAARQQPLAIQAPSQGYHLSPKASSDYHSEPPPSVNNNYLPPSAHIPRISTRNASPSKDSGVAMENELPWARGNPQPRNGKRGTAGWAMGQRITPNDNSAYLSDLSANYKPYYFSPLSYSYSPTHYDYNLYNYVFQDDFLMQTAAPPLPPKPFDSNYNSLNSSLSGPVYQPPTHPYQFGNSFADQRRWEKEQHRLELLRQIQDNENKKRMEKQKEWEEDERERRRAEVTLQRQRDEVRREEDDARHRQQMAELKAERAALELETTRARNGRRPRSPEISRKENRRQSTPSSNAAPRLEWWEKKPSWEERARVSQSPSVPALRNRTNNNNANNNIDSSEDARSTPLLRNSASSSRTNATRESRISSSMSKRSSSTDLTSVSRIAERRPSHGSRSVSRQSRHSYTPSVARVGSSVSQNSALRALDATQRRLDEELKAVRRRDRE